MIERKAPGALQPAWSEYQERPVGLQPGKPLSFQEHEDRIPNCPRTYAGVANASGRFCGDGIR